MAMELKAETSTVAVIIPLKGIPHSLMITGLTTMMYIVARKEVIPARTSVFTVVRFSSSLKKSLIDSSPDESKSPVHTPVSGHLGKNRRPFDRFFKAISRSVLRFPPDLQDSRQPGRVDFITRDIIVQ